LGIFVHSLIPSDNSVHCAVSQVGSAIAMMNGGKVVAPGDASIVSSMSHFLLGQRPPGTYDFGTIVKEVHFSVTET
jgi:hypothetical protein